MSEFWRRWHMTLSRWLRDYLYIPLGGNRHGKVRQYINNFATMVLGGLWHGAHWNFIIWGALHGVYLIVNQFVRAIAKAFGVLEIVETAKAIRISSWAITFLAAVVAWVFFRATTTSGAISMTMSMFGSVADGAIDLPANVQTILWGTLAAAAAFLLPNTKEISALFEKDLLKRSSALISALGVTSGIAASAAFLASLSLTQSPFLYFNF
jgi:D-alanyl-lipoteichoic acid acyltransferase DltB (MBOAT superfamily)